MTAIFHKYIWKEIKDETEIYETKTFLSNFSLIFSLVNFSSVIPILLNNFLLLTNMYFDIITIATRSHYVSYFSCLIKRLSSRLRCM